MSLSVIRFALVLLAGLLASHGAAADSLRCGSKLILEGDSIDKVLE